MALTSTQIDDLIELTRVALSAALSDPKPNYSIGNKTVNYADYIKMLNEQLNAYSQMQANIPSEQIRTYDYDVTSTGDDNTQLEGDNDI